MDEEIDYEIKIIIDGKDFGQSILHDLTIESIAEDIEEHFNDKEMLYRKTIRKDKE